MLMKGIRANTINGKRFILAVLCAALALTLIAPGAFSEEPAAKTVRVGWYDSPFNQKDQFGRRSGYAYEYQQKIAAYTGWTYEYVEASWPELLTMLEAGEIDLLSDVSFTQDRAERMLFASLPMGSESYYAFISSSNRSITPEDVSSFNGKRVGVNAGSVQAELFSAWAQEHGVQAELTPLTVTEVECMQMLYNGAIDVYVTIDAYGSDSACVPVCKIGQSDFYFAVSKARPDLLAELNNAMSRIQDENRFYNQQLFDQYVRRSGVNTFITSGEMDWLADHGAIRVGYRAGYLPYCDVDMMTGEFTGALKDYFAYAAAALKNADVEFVPMAYATVGAALEALQNGEVDCVFPVNLSSFDAEEKGLIVTSPLVRAELYAVVKNADRQSALFWPETTVAVVMGDVSREVFVKDNYPAWKVMRYSSTEECLRAVRGGEANCCLLGNSRVFEYDSIMDQYGLSAVATGKTIPQAFVLRRGSDQLYSILNKTIGLIPSATVDAMIASYSYHDDKVTVLEFIKENSASVIFVIIAVSLAIIVLLMQSLKNARRANEGERLINATELDPLTALYNKGFFFQYANRIHQDDPEKAMDAIVLDVERFHSVNALNGREFGDFVLRLIGGEIRTLLGEKEGIASRFDGDRFDIYCEHLDEYQSLFDRLQNRLNELSRNACVRLFMGVMPWEQGIDPSQQFDRAWSACNSARKGYQTRLIVYNQKMRDKEMQEQRLLNDLHRAVEDHQFEVYYQPKYNVQGSTPVLCSAEALVRWHHPELGLIPPDQFIPLFERDGRISMVDHYVWAEAAKQIARWRDQYGITVPVSVNLSRLDVFDPALESVLEELVERNKLDRKSLKLEVTESAYTDNAEHLVALIERLRGKGYEIEMDDFGTGYSSLNMLSSMPVDVLKMDKTFIQNLDRDDKDVHLVQLILEIAKTLKVPVVAEGVETESQMNLLKELGCALVQGYYFSHPMPPEDFGKNILGGAAAAE